MKKLLSAVLALAMLLSIPFTFAACGGPAGPVITADAVKDNAVKYLAEATTKAAENFFGDDAGVGEIVAGAFKGGSVNVNWDIPELFVPGDVTFDLTTTYSKDYSSAVAESKVTVEGTEYSAIVYIIDNVMALGGNVIGDTYKIDVFNFMEDLPESNLAAMLGDDFLENFTQMTGEMDAYFAQLKEQANTGIEDYQKKINTYLAALNQTVTANGDSIVVSYTVDADSIISFITAVANDYDDAQVKEMLDQSMETLKAQIEAMGVNIKLDITMSTKTSAVTSMKLTGAFGNESIGGAASINMESTFSDTEIKEALEVTYAGETVGIYSTLNKKFEGSKTVYTGALNVKAPEEVFGQAIDADIVDFEASYDKSSGDFNAKIGLNASALMSGDSVGIIGGGNVKYTATLNGNIKKSGDTATVTIGSVGALGMSIDLGITMTFKKTAEMPQIPADAKNVLDITEEDLAKLMESPIFAIFGGMSSAPAELVECTNCGKAVSSDLVDIMVEDGNLIIICPDCYAIPTPMPSPAN